MFPCCCCIAVRDIFVVTFTETSEMVPLYGLAIFGKGFDVALEAGIAVIFEVRLADGCGVALN
ncbi:MAG: hypothetical protein NVS4B11_36210 [Ktedonobacteraceae bacterium]